MLNLKIIGAGAAGNKAAIALAEKGFNLNDITLFNSTGKDIPEKFKDSAIIFGNTSDTLGGCGKERETGKKLFLDDLKTGAVTIDGLLDPDTNAVVIVSSTEGGTGSAITPILAKYIREVLGAPVIVCLFFGFNSDVRGMQNSIEISQELAENYGVICISNYKFLDAANGNTLKAEQLANDEFVRIIGILTGKDIHPGSQNIDDTDLFKLIATPGYMKVEHANISKIKNVSQYKDTISDAIDSSVLIDCEKGAKRIGVIYSVSEDMTGNIDFTTSTLQSEYGIPYELYTHVQDCDSQSTVDWIVAGLNLPLKEIQEIYENYLKTSTSVNKSRDSFFDSVMDMRGNSEDGMFNMLSTRKVDNTKAKSSFFADYGIGNEKPTKKKADGEY